MQEKPRVCVVGSINMDMVTTAKKMPAQGETVLGGSFETHPGGKGANQAVAAARLGAEVTLIGAVGDDAFGEKLQMHFQAEGIDHQGIQVIPEKSTGIATIILSENDNRIIVSSGANEQMTPTIVEKFKEQIIASDVIVVQFEIPMETINYTVDLAYQYKIPVIINPAPFQAIPEDMITKATYFTPNDLEAQAMLEMNSVQSMTDKLIVTKGDQGVQYISPEGSQLVIPAHEVPVKDTTGAGDTFNGALATEFARTKDLKQAIIFANASSALSVQRIGAQGGMPTREEVDQFLRTSL